MKCIVLDKIFGIHNKLNAAVGDGNTSPPLPSSSSTTLCDQSYFSYPQLLYRVQVFDVRKKPTSETTLSQAWPLGIWTLFKWKAVKIRSASWCDHRLLTLQSVRVMPNNASQPVYVWCRPMSRNYMNWILDSLYGWTYSLLYLSSE